MLVNEIMKKPPATCTTNERQEAERAAWAAPGVKQVDDRLTVVP